jgi:hypothetical protein
MRKEYIHFVREIYSYCDRHIGEEALFPVFVNLWHENGEESYIAKKDLAVFTSNIISHLLDKKVLSVIHSNTSPKDAYGFYKILPHEDLMRYNPLIDKKMKLLN